jgi:pyruvate kinase
MPRTKIVSTIGPSTSDPDVLRSVILSGTDVARLNFAHGSRDEHGRLIEAVRSIAAGLGRPVAILQDLAGPKIRTGPIEDGPVLLSSGEMFILTSRDVPGDADRVSVTYAGLPGDVRPGDALLLSDGAIELVVENTTADEIRCRVVTGGELDSHKGINVPSRSIGVPALGERDREDLEFGLSHEVDYVALSFVRSAEDVRRARGIVSAHGSEVAIIAKIERRTALDRIDEIIDAVDGIMVARGDLGVEIPLERIPRVQKTLIEKANRAGKPVITATQMLRSMVDNPRPTRAEVTDVANAVLEGSDAVMLSEETAVGRFPIDAVKMMARIISEAESDFPFDAWGARLDQGAAAGTAAAVAHSACRIASEVGAAAIVTVTQSGLTARLVARHRPSQPIVALTPSPRTYRRLAMVWGSLSVLTERVHHLRDAERIAIEAAAGAGLVTAEDRLVITAGHPIETPGTTNLVKVATV